MGKTGKLWWNWDKFWEGYKQLLREFLIEEFLRVKMIEKCFKSWFRPGTAAEWNWIYFWCPMSLAPCCWGLYTWDHPGEEPHLRWGMLKSLQWAQKDHSCPWNWFQKQPESNHLWVDWMRSRMLLKSICWCLCSLEGEFWTQFRIPWPLVHSVLLPGTIWWLERLLSQICF